MEEVEELDNIINFLNDKDFQNQIAPGTTKTEQITHHVNQIFGSQANSVVEQIKSDIKESITPQTFEQQSQRNQNQSFRADNKNFYLSNQQSAQQNVFDQQKQSDFIIRKTQNKRVMSHIRNNMIPPRTTKNQNSTSKKRKQQSQKPELITDYGKIFINNQNSKASYSDGKNLYKFVNNDSLQKNLKRKKNEIERHLSQESKENQQDQQNQKQNHPVHQFQENPQCGPPLGIDQIVTDEISNVLKKKFLVFRPYEDPMTIRPYQPPDRGYYFKLHNCDVKIIRYTLEDNGFREIPNKDNKDWTMFWSCCALKTSLYQSLSQYQKVNHFPSSFHITRKDLMYKQVSKMREIHGQKNFNFIPKTFLLPNEFVYLEAEMDKDKEKLWIAKPAASSQGKGIIVTNKLSEIPNKGNPHIVSEYIYNPLLFDGFKFDLRVYVAITSINPLRLYIYEEGLTRFATSKYNNNISGNKMQSKYTHLTNYSLNKNNPNFIQNTDPYADNVGQKWSLTALRKAFREQGIDDVVIWKKIEDIVIKTILSAENIMFQAFDQYCPFRNNCFELLGFDILIDNCLDPWLLEVNLSPSLACDSPLDQKIKSNLIADLFTMAGVVPLEQRKTNDASFQKKGLYLAEVGMGQNKQRETHTAYGGEKRKLNETNNAFSIYGQAKHQPLSQKQEKQLIKETEQEFKRRGRFKRVFPSLEYHYYKQFFTEERQLNYVLDQRVMSKRRLNNAVSSAMSMKQKIEYLSNKSNLIILQNPTLSTQILPQAQKISSMSHDERKDKKQMLTSQIQQRNQQQQQQQSQINTDLYDIKSS